MPYQDYSNPQIQRWPGAQPQVMPRLGSVGGAGMGAAGAGGATGTMGGVVAPGAAAGPDGPGGALPANTRQQNLQSVQEAYARPPGDMGHLNALLDQSGSPVSASDPTIAPAFAAGRVADQRNMDRQRAALGEQLGGTGLGSSGAMQTKTGGIQQRIGEQQASRESGMLYDEGNARRNALLQALGLDQSRYQGDNDMGYRLAALEAQLNQNSMNSLQGWL